MRDSLDALAADVRCPRAEVRRSAVLCLAEAFTQEPVARAAVVAALADPVWCVREAASLGLARFPDTDGSIHAALVALTLRDPSPHVRAAAATTAGPHVLPERDYGAAVRHRFERQRGRAALALGCAPPGRAPEAVSLLSLCVTDSHPKVRLAAVHALSRLEPVAVLSLLPTVVRKCAEADIAAAARSVWVRVLTCPAAEPLRPLEPYPGTRDLVGVRAALAALPAGHALRRVWEARPAPSEEALTAHRFARHLAAVCEGVLAVTA